MTLLTPRRRISSRTKRRCRVIKDFFSKALGQSSKTSSQIKDKTHSSIELSISDLRQKISGIETQLEKISKHCIDLTSLDNTLNQCEKKLTVQDDLSSDETKVLFKASKDCIKNHKEIKSEQFNRHSLELQHEVLNGNDNCIQQPCDGKHYRYKKIESTNPANTRYSGKERPNINISGYSSHKRKHSKKVYQRPTIIMQESYNNKEKTNFINTDNKHKKPRCRDSKERKYTEMDQEFISDIIQKHYKPVKLFGRRTSEYSQFSAPVCRDGEFSKSNRLCDDTNLCSCCFDKCRKYDYTNIHNSDVSDMKSICDARLYSSKRRTRHKKSSDDYNNSEYYDLVPVKEKSSPKSRRKFAENNTSTRHYTEVPPSPKTQRPRFNLQAKSYDDCDEIKPCRSTHDSDKKVIYADNDSSPEIFANNRKNIVKVNQKKTANQINNVCKYDNDTVNSTSDNDKLNANESSDKTLGEIKDLLQSFLNVIKKDSIHNENGGISPKNIENNPCELQDTSKPTCVPPILNNYSGGNVAPIIPVYPNTCCYPIMPIYPVSYLQNGFTCPNASNPFTSVPTSTKKPKESSSLCNDNQDESTDTQELIKEIYNIVTRNPKSFRKYPTTNRHRSRSKFTKDFRTRSVGNSSIGSRHSPNLVRPTPRCVSKSCEAIGSRRRDTFNGSISSLSETVLEGLSVEVTHSSTELELESSSGKEQIRGNKTNIFKDILKPWKWRRKKREIIDQFTESESTIEVDIRDEAPPFRQNVMNYAMHEQEFYHPPPINGRNFNNKPYYPHSLGRPNLGKYPGYAIKRQNPRPRPQGYINKQNYSRYQHSPQFSSSSYHNNLPSYPYQNYHPSYDPNYNPNYVPHYQHNVPQVPLCLKEIEVKSMGTQSERKVSLFKKLAHKVKVQQDAQRQYTRPAVQPTYQEPVKAKPGKFSWKALQENAKLGMAKEYSLKTQKNLARGDANMRNAMIKKIFHKRNPFSPRNLIIKTLLGNDPSSFGNAQKYVKPKLFV